MNTQTDIHIKLMNTKSFPSGSVLDIAMELVCDYFKVRKEDFLSPKRLAKIVNARKHFVALCYCANPEFTWVYVSGYLNRDHSTILHSLSSWHDSNVTDSFFQRDFKSIRSSLCVALNTEILKEPFIRDTLVGKRDRRKLIEKQKQREKFEKLEKKLTDIQQEVQKVTQQKPPIVLYNHAMKLKEPIKIMTKSSPIVGFFGVDKIIN